MENNLQKNLKSTALESTQVTGFPETDHALLRNAAAGHWEPFLQAYLPACWREVVIRCRQKGLQLADSENLYQDLVVRLMREGTFGKQIRDALGEQDYTGDFRGNVPARYLYHRDSPLTSAKFRTYLKATIKHIIAEAVRRQHCDPILDPQCQFTEAQSLDDSIQLTVERNWIISGLHAAARQLERECRRSSTRGRQRWPQILRMSSVDGLSATEIASRLGLDRSTVSESLKQVRKKYVMLLLEITNLDSPADIKQLLSTIPGVLQQALADELCQSEQEGGDGRAWI